MRIDFKLPYEPVIAVDYLLRGERVDWRAVLNEARENRFAAGVDVLRIAIVAVGFVTLLGLASEGAYWLGYVLGGA